MGHQLGLLEALEDLLKFFRKRDRVLTTVESGKKNIVHEQKNDGGVLNRFNAVLNPALIQEDLRYDSVVQSFESCLYVTWQIDTVLGLLGVSSGSALRRHERVAHL